MYAKAIYPGVWAFQSPTALAHAAEDPAAEILCGQRFLHRYPQNVSTLRRGVTPVRPLWDAQLQDDAHPFDGEPRPHILCHSTPLPGKPADVFLAACAGVLPTKTRLLRAPLLCDTPVVPRRLTRRRGRTSVRTMETPVASEGTMGGLRSAAFRPDTLRVTGVPCT